MSRRPDGPAPPPVVQRLRLRYAKRGRLRFTSHRDFQRAFERALRRAGVPVAFSAGFTPHPKVSYAGAAPTGVASEAEYLELGLAEERDPDEVRIALDRSLPPGLDVLEVVPVPENAAPLADALEASHWEIVVPGVGREQGERAVTALLATGRLTVERLGKNGRREVDVRAALVSVQVCPEASAEQARSGDAAVQPVQCAILRLVVRHATPAVRPDDVLVALGRVADLVPTAPPLATRLQQGRLTASGGIVDPLAEPPADPLSRPQSTDAAGTAPTR